ncbi:TetR/AcrR family transcriptional regulator [Beijerinckia sp. L45]|uniref:TetR/AcrR family transcriptional regulator n=1 Tax=Beijerinckia sp. L45 TaxID=1641855 RepID=UPI00131BD980|nr:TetR/AcrR family transcriptional regulator [Beijerinckia sp. L45]
MGLVPKVKTKRFPRGSARERILIAAEGLFAEAGLDGVSFRELSNAAGVSLSAIHYYFGSKHAVLEEVFTRNSRGLTEARAILLETALAERMPSLEAVIDAFLRPALEVTRGDRNEVFNRLRARLAVEQGEITRKIVSGAFDANDKLFLDAFTRLLPELNREDLHWRFHFLVGAMIHTMSDSGQLQGLSEGLCSPADTRRALDALVTSFAALFRAPALNNAPPILGSRVASFADAIESDLSQRL